MAISMWFDKSIIVQRLDTSSGYKKTMSSTGTIEGNLQRVEDTDTMDVYGVQGALYKAYVDVSADVKEGDTVVIERITYSVVAINDLEQDFMMNNHKELILKKYNAQN